jgi:MYXO-CTERM domain-containing protein
MSLTAHDAFTYRAWADPGGNHIPTDGPQADYTPHPTGTPGTAKPGPLAPILVTMEGFNKNPDGKVDPWLGPSDTFTFGNNVKAYSDRNDYTDEAGSHHNDGYDEGVDIRADVTGPKTFDRIYDVTRAPNFNTDQIKAAVTQIFYVTNWLHDYWYDSGFDEKSGNAQLSNYGRGGVEGDPLRAEAQDEADNGALDNANMSSFSDGTSPRMQMYVWSSNNPLRPSNPPLDGTIDNTIVAHEWGHYLHHRLMFCGSQSCGGMSEGWADFNALMMVIKDGDTFEAGKVYPLAQYASAVLWTSLTAQVNAPYFGIRRAPYSTDMTKNPFTFKHVRKMSMLPTGAPLSMAAPDMSEVHNVGEIWASALFEAYVNLLAVGKAANRPFEETKRRMANYVVAGLKATPPEPTFVEQRDAILSTVLASGQTDDFTALAKGFAKRGLGAGAIAPPTSSETLDEAVENFDYKGNLALVDAKIDDSTRSCDRDGYLDASEAGKLNLRVRNGGWVALTKSQVKVTSSDPNITFDGGGTVMLPSLAPYQMVPVSVGVSVSSGAKRSTVPITITLSDPDAATPAANASFSTVVNFDDKSASSATDDAESDHPAFVPTASPKPLPILAWSRKGNATNHVWHGDDIGAAGDETLVSPTLVVGSGAPFTIGFSHAYSFELGPVTPGGGDVYFDGGVLEVSDDNGATWKDVSTYANPNYPRTIYNSGNAADPSKNPLTGRRAWGGKSANYPMMQSVSLNLGTQLAGKMVKVRFRIGTDEGSGAAGWDIDNIAFGGITNTPFATLVDNATPACGDAGVPNPPDSGTPEGGMTTGSGGSAGGGGAGGGSAGAAGSSAGGRGAGGATSTVTGRPPAPEDNGGCSCRTSAPRSTRLTGLLTLIGALALKVRRRRKVG